jgi:TonB family protein
MRNYKFVLAVMSMLGAVPALTAAAENGSAPTCVVTQPAAIRTDFPKAAQSRGEHGDVLLQITIGKDGRAVATQVTHSSGFPSLDKAAADSVIQHWRFDVAHCAPSELPAHSFVTIQFQRAVQYTVYGTLNRHRSAIKNDVQAQSRCDSIRDAAGDQIIACLANSSLAGRSGQPTLASASVEASK